MSPPVRSETVSAAGEISLRDYDEALENFRRFKLLPDASVWYLTNWAEGRVDG